MQLVPIEEVQHKLVPGMALPWNVRNAQGVLLLAKGSPLPTEGMVEVLRRRGVFVDVTDLASVQGGEGEDRQPASLAHRWYTLADRLGSQLRAVDQPTFIQRIQESVSQVITLVDADADEVIFLIVRHDHARFSSYGVAHSLHTATLCALLSQQMQWTVADRISLVGAALTMNLSMLDLQGVLASRSTPPTPAERRSIHEHPATSARWLREAGLTDSAWLGAVEQHHEVSGGGGYPQGLHTPGEMSQIVRFIDNFTAKHSPRASRKPLPAQQAARDLFMQSSGNPLASLLIKELGIYPPGCYVKLASGEIAVVTHRGESAKTPRVAAVTSPNGDVRSQPLRRDTSLPTHAITGTVPSQAVKLRVGAQDLYERRTGPVQFG
ncbi:HD-GYP domain-containing protein [Acidovorax sp. RAC01]|uniref:HD-GYP domain-containing protein n=1 Tax=Acidovorax sp. RAC01 TaxID=1842533 RepID=UPI0008581A67|nr:HD domain-containing phosphohydrolase [Acidovorax sp. RAC01]AOG23859.1 HD domain protein [Acidovorax sp. RAC01]